MKIHSKPIEEHPEVPLADDGRWEAIVALSAYALRRSDGVRVRVVWETPPDSRAEAVRPTLEEAYLYAVEGFDEGQPMNGADEKEDRLCHARWVG